MRHLALLLTMIIFSSGCGVLQAKTPYQQCEHKLDGTLAVLSSGWSREITQNRYYTAEQAGLTSETLPGLQLQWSFVFDGAVHPRSLPAITDKAIFIGSEEGAVWALDRHTGCVFWRFQADNEVRTAISVSAINGRQHVFFGDNDANAYAVDALTGDKIWQRKIDEHSMAVITGSPVVHNGSVYVPASSLEVALAMSPLYSCCTFRGSVSRLNAATGELLWKSYTIPDAPNVTSRNALGVRQYGAAGAPVWSAPTIDVTRGLIYLGTGQNYSSPADTHSDAIHAIDLETGEPKWHRQFLSMDAWNAACNMGPLGTNCPAEDGPDYDFGAPPMLVTAANGKQLIIAGQKSGMVYAMDADTHDVLWSKLVGRGGLLGGVHWGMASDGEFIYAPVSDADIWGTTIPGKPNPSLSKLDLITGNIVWQVPAVYACENRKGCRSGISAALTLVPGAIIAPGLDGHLRAYATQDGRVLWEVDTTLPVQGINGVEGAGGTLDAGGAVVADGQLFINSGYGGIISAGGKAGNVFSVYGVKH